MKDAEIIENFEKIYNEYKTEFNLKNTNNAPKLQRQWVPHSCGINLYKNELYMGVLPLLTPSYALAHEAAHKIMYDCILDAIEDESHNENLLNIIKERCVGTNIANSSEERQLKSLGIYNKNRLKAAYIYYSIPNAWREALAIDISNRNKILNSMEWLSLYTIGPYQGIVQARKFAKKWAYAEPNLRKYWFLDTKNDNIEKIRILIEDIGLE